MFDLTYYALFNGLFIILGLSNLVHSWKERKYLPHRPTVGIICIIEFVNFVLLTACFVILYCFELAKFIISTPH